MNDTWCFFRSICRHFTPIPAVAWHQTSVHVEETWIKHQTCVQLEKNEHPHPNFDCLFSTYPGIKNPHGLSHGRAGRGPTRALRAPAGHDPYSPYSRRPRAGPRARTIEGPNPAIHHKSPSFPRFCTLAQRKVHQTLYTPSKTLIRESKSKVIKMIRTLCFWARLFKRCSLLRSDGCFAPPKGFNSAKAKQLSDQ